MMHARSEPRTLRAMQVAHAIASALPTLFLLVFATSILLARARSGAWPVGSIEAYPPSGPSPREGIGALVGLADALFWISIPAVILFLPLSLLTLARTFWHGRERRAVLAWTGVGALSALGLWVVAALDPGGFYRALLA
jgi:hypothetical protein